MEFMVDPEDVGAQPHRAWAGVDFQSRFANRSSRKVFKIDGITVKTKKKKKMPPKRICDSIFDTLGQSPEHTGGQAWPSLAAGPGGGHVTFRHGRPTAVIQRARGTNIATVYDTLADKRIVLSARLRHAERNAHAKHRSRRYGRTYRP